MAISVVLRAFPELLADRKEYLRDMELRSSRHQEMPPEQKSRPEETGPHLVDAKIFLEKLKKLLLG